MRRTWRSMLVGCVVTGLVLAGGGVASAQEGGPPTGPYVALGDSYTSAPLTGTNAGSPIGCLRSVTNYPHLVAERLGVPLTDVSCSGATTDGFRTAQRTNAGTNPPQFSALTRDTALVTIGIGGNDIGFAEIVRTCLSALPVGTPCRDRYTAGGTDQLRARIAALGPTLARVLREVHRRAPEARVALVGYPSVLPASGFGCYPAVPIAPGDVAYLRGILTELNTRLERSAAAGDATWVDTAGPSVGHDFCQAPGVKWVEGLVPTAPAYPFHPNAAGSEATSRAVVETLADAAAE
ncbi:SGNH/GDSL hydrolase family protein [Actinomycetospora termitidis]|uniref:SGNH/GDSL hydrolase family protein n=1 Tax=Actinomycetospora termitidis TaxID=3053470 RepID=A0ABT7M406_9PSEU|nr:SGNH/GDSL hydrolase family protein [Actinomycetospora sp. Odt1-22]MDL5155408.1 SGNH/GDSL hydrolase family protein [Actinomycetospora sp. Odt1-22]